MERFSTSPFFVHCKYGVLQYVLLKFISSIIVMILELHNLYKEGDFSWSSGYLYICILTNLSQCWALYCMIFFYYATVNELTPIRPVGKFLSVKALVFFTWWQSVVISFIYQMDLIPHYHSASGNESEWTSEDVAKGLQDYLICIEMFIGAIVHVFVFPHGDYLPHAVQARKLSSAKYIQLHPQRKRQLGRKRHYHNRTNYAWLYNPKLDDVSQSSKNSGDVEMASHTEDYYKSPQRTPPVSPMRIAEEVLQQSTDSSRITTAPDHDDTLEQEEHQILLAVRSMSAEEGGGLDGDENDDLMNVEVDDDDDAILAAHSASSAAQEASASAAAVSDVDDLAISAATTGTTDDEHDDALLPDDSEYTTSSIAEPTPPKPTARKGFVKALIESSIPKDVIDQSVGMIVNQDYVVEKSTLLHHAFTSDQYDLFRNARSKQKNPKQQD